MKKIAFLILIIISINSKAFFPIPSISFNQYQDKYHGFVDLLYDYQPDFAREQRIIEQIADSVIEGEVQWLQVGDKKVFSIYSESDSDKSKGGAIILHSRGLHANWELVVKPIRVGLAEKGWDSLSVQMPVKDKNAKYYDYVPIFPYAMPRINAAIDFLKKQGVKKIVIIAHACGAFMARYFIEHNGVKDISAFVGIGMNAIDYKQQVINPIILTLFNTDIPILDIVAENDYLGVLKFFQIRQEAFAIINNPKNKQVIIPNTGHYYRQSKASKQLVAEIAKWLDNI